MRAIWKYRIQIEDRTVVDMPAGAIFRALAQQSDDLYCTLWYEVPDTDAEKKTRIFGIFGTGYPLPNEPMTYLGTMVVGYLGLVSHVYEIKG